MKKTKKESSSMKKLLALFAFIVAIIGTINLVWYFGVKLSYEEFTKGFEIVKTDTGENRFKIVDDYKFSADMPKYLEFSGYLSVGQKDGVWANYDKKGNIISSSGLFIQLDIIPDIFKNYKYRLWLADEEKEIDSIVFIDENGNYIPTKSTSPEVIENTTSFLNENKEEIERLLSKGKDFWDIK